MKSRMEKYYNESEQSLEKRSFRNEELYKTITDSDILDFNINSNIAILGDNKDKLDINEIQDLVRERYEEAPKRRSIPVAKDSTQKIDLLDETKDYDINSVLDKARSEKTIDYQTDRLKKLRDTQYSILQNLEMGTLKKDEDSKGLEEPNINTMSMADEKLMTLIQTITSKEFDKQKSEFDKEQAEKEVDPLDILSDLKGTDNTILTKAVSVDDPLPKTETKRELDNTFYTASNAFTQSDFDDINDLKEDVRKGKFLIKILIGLIVLAFIFGLVVLLNTVLDLGWF